MAVYVNTPIIRVLNDGQVGLFLNQSYQKLIYTTDGTTPTASTSTHVTENGYIGTFNKGTVIKAITEKNYGGTLYYSDVVSVTVLDSTGFNASISYYLSSFNKYTISVNATNTALGDIYVSFDDTDPANSDIIWPRSVYYNLGISDEWDNFYWQNYNCKVRCVYKYGDYTSEEITFDIGEGHHEILPPVIVSMNPIELTNPNTKDYIKTEVTYATANNTYDWQDYNTIINVTALSLRARCYEIAPVGINEQGRRYSEEVSQGSTIAYAPTITMADTKITITNPNSDGIIMYSINGAEFSEYQGIFEPPSNAVINAYVDNVGGDTQSSVVTFNVGKLSVSDPIVNITYNYNNKSVYVTVENYEDEVNSINIDGYRLRCELSYPEISYSVTYTGTTTLPYRDDVTKITVQFFYYNEVDRLIDQKEVTVDITKAPTLDPPLINDDNYEYVTLSNPNTYGSIYYTKDGSDPNASGILLTSNNVYLQAGQTIRAIVKYNQIVSTIAQLTFNPLEAPIISVENHTITITNPNSIGTIYYKLRTDSTVEDAEEHEYTGPISVGSFWNVSAQVRYNTKYSRTSYAYASSVTVLNSPTINIDDNGYVTITNNEPDATLYYKVNYPIAAPSYGDVYTNGFYVEENSTVYAVAVKDDQQSKVVSAIYTKDIIEPDGTIIDITGGEDKPLVSNTSKNFVDVIFASNYEVPKSIEAISYVLNFIINKFDINKPSEETLNRRYSGDNLIVYNDETSTGLLDINTDKNEINKLNNYKYPYWDKGKWNLNYFRNTIATNTKPTNSDKQSLIFGKYFVIRFIFNNDCKFKLETVEPIIKQY